MRRPAVTLAVLFVVGILLADKLDLSAAICLSTGFLLLLLATLRSAWRGWLIPPLLIVLGAAAWSGEHSTIGPLELRHTQTGEPELVHLTGRLLETPRETRNLRDGIWRYRTRVRLAVDAIEPFYRDRRSATGTVLVTYPDKLPSPLDRGCVVKVTGVLERPPGPFASGMFDYREHLRVRGVHFLLKTDTPADWQILEEAAPALETRFIEWAKNGLSRGFPDGEPTIELLWAMSLGWRTALSDEVAEPFMRSGTMHLFAISGLHVALIATMLVNLLRFLRFSRGRSGLVVIPLLWFYAAATGWQPSAVRATMMASVVLFGWSLRRPPDLLNSIAVAGLLLLVWQPGQLFQAGFQLSFAVVISIALFLPHLEMLQQRVLFHDPLLPPELRPRWQQWLDAPFRFATSSAVISLAACCGSLPLIMLYFHLLTPVTVFTNLLVVPLGAAALSGCLGSLLTGAWWPAGGELFNHAAWLFMRIMTAMSEFSSTLPGAYHYTKAPPIMAIVCYYVALVLVVTNLRRRFPRLAWSGVALAVLIAGVAWWQVHRHPTVTVLPLGRGHAVFVDQPGDDSDWLIDCGDAYHAEVLVKPFLRSRGVDRLPHLVLTHGDVAHMGGATNLVTAFQPRNVYQPDAPFRSGTFRAWEQFARTNGLEITRLAAGDNLGDVRALHPAAGAKIGKADAATLVLEFRLNERRVLLLGDLDEAGLEALLARSDLCETGVLVAEAADAGNPHWSELVSKIRPRLFLVAAQQGFESKGATEVHPSVRTIVAGQSGAAEFKFAEQGVRIHQQPQKLDRIPPK